MSRHALAAALATALGAAAGLCAAPALAADGAQLFALQCRACHQAASTPMAPALTGVAGAKIAVRQDFAYSPALKNAHLTWDGATLDKWLQNPSGLVRGTTMFVNVASSADRQNLIAYLRTLSSDAKASR